MKKLKIEMVHDLVCSWCPIGYRNIQTAIKNLNIEVEFYFLPFELNPNMGQDGEAIASYFHRQSGWNERKLLDYQQSLVSTAGEAGVKIDFSKRTRYFNTHQAHLLMHWAERFDKQMELNQRLIEAYFENGLDISNNDVLLNTAQSAGLDRAATVKALSSGVLEQQLKRKIERKNTLNVSSVPAFVINDNSLISGSNSVEYFEQALSMLIKQPLTT